MPSTKSFMMDPAGSLPASTKKTRRLPVVILASSDEERDIINGYKFGANGYVSKPAEFNDFTEALKQLGLYWLKLNRPPVAMG